MTVVGDDRNVYVVCSAWSDTNEATQNAVKIQKNNCFSKKHIPPYGPCWHPELGHP